MYYGRKSSSTAEYTLRGPADRTYESEVGLVYRGAYTPVVQQRMPRFELATRGGVES